MARQATRRRRRDKGATADDIQVGDLIEPNNNGYRATVYWRGTSENCTEPHVVLSWTYADDFSVNASHRGQSSGRRLFRPGDPVTRWLPPNETTRKDDTVSSPAATLSQVRELAGAIAAQAQAIADGTHTASVFAAVCRVWSNAELLKAWTPDDRQDDPADRAPIADLSTAALGLLRPCAGRTGWLPGRTEPRIGR
jgi:hypothetical protein